MSNLKVASFVVLLAAVSLALVAWGSADSSGDGGQIIGEGSGDGVSLLYTTDPIPITTFTFDRIPSGQIRIDLVNGTSAYSYGPFPALKEINVETAPLTMGKWAVLVSLFSTGAQVASATMTVGTFHTLNFDSNGGSGSMEAMRIIDGTSKALPDCAFTAPQGKEFIKWSINGQEYNPGDRVSLSSTTSAKAVWADMPRLSVVKEGKGTVTGEGSYAKGTQVKVSASPEEGYHFDHWEKDDVTVSSEPDYSFTIQQDTVLKAVFVSEGGDGIALYIIMLAGLAVLALIIVFVLRYRK